MSMVPTYVRASDGRFYKNPVLTSEDGFICFDDNDPPELVMKTRGSKVTNEAAELQMDMFLGAGRWAGLLRAVACRRLFGLKTEPAMVFWFRLTHCIPVPVTHQGCECGKPKHDCVIYDPETPPAKCSSCGASGEDTALQVLRGGRHICARGCGKD